MTATGAANGDVQSGACACDCREGGEHREAGDEVKRQPQPAAPGPGMRSTLVDDDPADRRRVLVAPVADQVVAARKYFRSSQQSLARLYERYSESELKAIADFLERSTKMLHEETSKLSAPQRERG